MKFEPAQGLWHGVWDRGDERIGIIFYPRIASWSIVEALGEERKDARGQEIDKLVCFTRNPYDRVKSLWNLHNSDLPPKIHTDPLSFKHFVDHYVKYAQSERDQGKTPNKHWISQYEGLNGMKLHKFWRIDSEGWWEDFLDWMGMEYRELPRIHESKLKPRASQYTCRKIKRRLHEDFRLFGY